MTKSIPLTKGKFALVDDGDYEWLNQWKWCADSKGYAVRVCNENGKPKTVKMHSLVLGGRKEGFDIDHINLNKSDNRKENLRFCTRAQNMWNQKAHKNNTSGFKGVTFNKWRNKWEARISTGDKRIFLGYFDTAIQASRAYDLYSIKIHGEFARLNNGQ